MKTEGFLNPIEILKYLDLDKEMIAADFGSGSGGWAIPLAKKLSKGRVYAIDILEEPLSALKSKLGIEKLANVETVRADIESGSGLRDESLDLVLATNLFFQAEDKKSVLKEIKRVLKKRGKALIVDWTPGSAFNPNRESVSPEDMKNMAKEIGFRTEKEFEAGAYHWGLILVK